MTFRLFVTLLSLVILTACVRQTSRAEENMTPEHMSQIIKRIDKDMQAKANNFVFKVKKRDLMLVYDLKADRMRIMSPITETASLPPKIYLRLLQADFDAALDARYAIANDVIWSVFIHPLGSLSEDDFVSAIAQTYTAAETFGSSYTSGALVFGGGDSNALHKKLLEDLKNASKSKDPDY